MNAGRELDALIAEKVMGWTKVDSAERWGRWKYGDPGDEWTDIKEEWCRGVGIPPSCEQTQPIPRFSEFIEAAWLVHEHCGALLFSQRRRYLDELTAVIQTELGQPVAWPDALLFLKPHHICLAALKAKGAL